ncbi:MAG: caspase family protein [Geminicoccaceae bacterium]
MSAPTAGDRCREQVDAGGYRAAITACGEAIRADPGNGEAYSYRCAAYIATGNAGSAIADCSAALRLDPKSVAAYGNRCAAYNAAGNHQAAIADCSQAVRLDPQSVAAYNNRCTAYYQTGDYQAAITDCGMAIRLDPTSVAAYGNRCAAYSKAGDLEAAIADCGEAVQRAPQSVAAYSNRARVYAQAGQLAEARVDLAEAVRLRPDDAGLKERLRGVETRLASLPSPAPAVATASVTVVPSAPAVTPTTPTSQATPAAQSAATSMAALPAATLPAAVLPPARLAEHRVALVIGNGGYGGAAELDNPPHDAELIATTLRGIGFEVAMVRDGDQKRMRGAIRDFGARLGQLGDDAVAFFYFSGHGIQIRDTNFLIPVGARIDRDTDVPVEAVQADEVLRQMDYAHSRINFVIIDACRNNPLARSYRGLNRGLARMDGPRGTLIAYSTAPGEVAWDGAEGSNSPYASALARALRLPGVAAEEMFRTVRQEVLKATDERQVPWESSSLTAAFYFVPRS